MPTVIETSDEMVNRKVSGESLSFAEKILRKHGWKSGIWSVSGSYLGGGWSGNSPSIALLTNYYKIISKVKD